MSNDKFFIINLLVGFTVVALHFFFQVPFWIVFLVLIPIAVMAMVTWSAIYNFREDLQFEPVDREKYESRVRELEKDAVKLKEMGFEKIDEFYMKLNPDNITYIFKHNEYPVYFCVYQMGPKRVGDVVTIFTNDCGLTTGSLFDAGCIPRGEKEFLQIFENQPYERLFDEHLTSLSFLREKNLNPRELSASQFREEFMKSLKDTGDRIKSYPVWPFLLLFWVVSAHGRRYEGSIKSQLEKGLIEFKV